jgi:hypothetical protein
LKRRGHLPVVGVDPCWVEAASCAATTKAPRKRCHRRGGIQGELLVLSEVRPVTLCGRPMTRSQKSGSSARSSPAKGSSRANRVYGLSCKAVRHPQAPSFSTLCESPRSPYRLTNARASAGTKRTAISAAAVILAQWLARNRRCEKQSAGGDRRVGLGAVLKSPGLGTLCF